MCVSVFGSFSGTPLLSVGNRACDTSCMSSVLLCSIWAGMFTDSSGTVTANIVKIFKTPQAVLQFKEFFMASICRILPMIAEHCGIPWEEPQPSQEKCLSHYSCIPKPYVYVKFTKYCRENTNGKTVFSFVWISDAINKQNLFLLLGRSC